MMRLMPIDLPKLASMQKILSDSAGYETSMEDELEYFRTTNPKSWFAAVADSDIPIGFIRSFSQGPDWTLGEIFVSQESAHRTETARVLGMAFLKENNFEKGHRLRFDVSKFDIDINRALQELGLSDEKKEFLYFEMPLRLADATQPTLPVIRDSDYADISEALVNLHPVTLLEITDWVQNNQLRVSKNGESIVSVAQLVFYTDSVEIVRFATKKSDLRKGNAQILLSNICAEMSNLRYKKIFLKVESIRQPAISCYKKMGFQEITSKAQVWHSKWF